MKLTNFNNNTQAQEDFGIESFDEYPKNFDLRDSFDDIGEEVSGYCPVCKNITIQTIVDEESNLRIKQVLCGDCGSEHNFQKRKPQEVRAKSSSPVTKGLKGKMDAWELVVKNFKNKNLPTYNLRAKYCPGDALLHSKFGIGVVNSLAGQNKMVVLFESGQRKLIFNRK